MNVELVLRDSGNKDTLELWSNDGRTLGKLIAVVQRKDFPDYKTEIPLTLSDHKYDLKEVETRLSQIAEFAKNTAFGIRQDIKTSNEP